MIAPLQALLPTTESASAPNPQGPTDVKQQSASFDNLLFPVASSAEPEVKHLGPMFANTILGPTNPPAATVANVQSQAVTVEQVAAAATETSGIPSGLINFTNRAMHEQTMNTWLEKSTQAANDEKMQIYSQAVVNWKLNESRYRELGLPVPPQPQPPMLDPVQPMPKGWWFEDTRG